MRPRSPFGPADRPAAASGHQAEQADRRAATRAQIAEDQVAVERLRQTGFQGPGYESFAHRLVTRGYRVMNVWTVNRKIFGECRKRMIFLAAIDEWTEDDRASLVQDTLATGYRRFHEHALCAGGWSPEGGASLGTYFVGDLVYAFADEYRPWYNAEIARRIAQRELVPEMGAVLGDRAQRVGALALDRDAVRAGLAHLARIDPRLPKIIALDVEGYTYNEIAELLGDGTSPRAIEGIIYRHRRRLEERRRR